jgi:hypothetical protein
MHPWACPYMPRPPVLIVAQFDWGGRGLCRSYLCSPKIRVSYWFYFIVELLRTDDSYVQIPESLLASVFLPLMIFVSNDHTWKYTGKTVVSALASSFDFSLDAFSMRSIWLLLLTIVYEVIESYKVIKVILTLHWYAKMWNSNYGVS